MSAPFVTLRLVLYFAIWGGFSLALAGLSRKQDSRRRPRGGRAEDAVARGAGPRPARPRRLVLLLRLPHVGERSLVLDDLRALRPRRAGRLGDGARHPRRAAPLLASADVRRPSEAARPRPRKAPARLHDALGVLRDLAVPDHLVGRPPGGGRLLHGPLHRRMGGRGARHRLPPLRPSVLPPPVARPEARREEAVHRRRASPRHAVGRPLLARRAGLQPEAALVPLARPRDARGHGRPLALRVRTRLAALPAPRRERPEPRGGAHPEAAHG